jgi:hypothetical protein
MSKISTILFSLALICVVCSYFAYSQGEKTGTIIEFSRKGFVVKTWEGVMVLGGTGASANQNNTWKFTVWNSDLIEKIKSAQEKKSVVTLSFKEQYIVMPWSGDSKNIITDVR